MDHNTGPLARKSTTLCALLLVSIAALLVFAIPGQANGEEVGVANHTKNGSDVTLKEDCKPAGEDLTYAEYVKRFPTVCNFTITKKYIELLYDGRNCTVELITNETNVIKFKTGYMKKDGCNLDKCVDGETSFEDGFSNLLPFAYSRNNKDIETLNNNEGPIEANDNKVCAASFKCGKKCINQTFLEVSWSKCQDFVVAHVHLIGEYSKGRDPSEEEKGTNKTEFNLEIYNNSRIKLDFDRKTKDDFFGLKSYCAPKENPLVNPETWKITNEDKDLEGKHLLVFHLLPQSATQWYKGDNIERNLNRTRPECDLFIRFKRPAYEFLRVDPPTTTTSTTTTTTSKPVTKPSAEKTTSTTRPQQGTTTNVEEVKDTKKGSSAGTVIIILLVLAFVSVLIGGCVYAGLDYRKKQQKEKEEEAAKAAATEAAKAAEAAAAEAAEAEDEKERAYWFNFGDTTEIADQNFKRAALGLMSVEDQFVKEILDRMEKEDKENAEKDEEILIELYLPDVAEKGFAKVGTFREWRKKSRMIQEKGETSEEFDKRVEKAIKRRGGLKKTVNALFNRKQSKDEAAGGKKTEDSKVKNDQAPKEETTSKDSALKNDPAPEKADATKSKQAGTTSDVPTDMVSEAKETDM
ncbi:unnamed protein product [Meloidogyne enterolobii]|uniref:Uncharacterized protein n=1 Tax=Meloidogyne enterolobii TaxID=390850 RepID=A0ACB0YZZ6_MELEN